MDIKPLAFAVAGAVAGVVGSTALKVSAGPAEVALFDPAQTDGAAFKAWRDGADRTCVEQQRVCEAIRRIGDSADRMAQDRGVKATRVEDGHYTIEHPSRSAGVPSVTVDLRVTNDAPEQGKKTP